MKISPRGLSESLPGGGPGAKKRCSPARLRSTCDPLRSGNLRRATPARASSQHVADTCARQHVRAALPAGPFSGPGGCATRCPGMRRPELRRGARNYGKPGTFCRRLSRGLLRPSAGPWSFVRRGRKSGRWSGQMTRPVFRSPTLQLGTTRFRKTLNFWKLCLGAYLMCRCWARKSCGHVQKPIYAVVSDANKCTQVHKVPGSLYG